MKVLMLCDKSVQEVNKAYGMRLIEQGKAIPASAEKPAKAKTVKAETAKGEA